MIYPVTNQKRTATAWLGKIQSALRCAVAALLLAIVPAALATTYTFNQTASGTYNWSAASGSFSSVPVSAATNTLTFGSGSLAASATVVATNDISSPPFLLNALNITYAGPASGTAPTLTLQGNQLEFINNGATAPTIVFSTTGTIKPSVTISNDIQLQNDVAITSTTDSFLTGLLSGPGGLTKSGAGAIRYDGNSTSYAGNIGISAGMIQIGNATSGSASLGTGTITLSGSGSFQIRKTANQTINNTITGTTTGTVSFQPIGNGANIIYTLNKANTYTAPTTLTSGTSTSRTGTLKLGIANGLPTTTDLTIQNASGTTMTFDLGGFNQTLNSLATSAGGSTANSIVTTSTGTPTLTISGTTNTTYAGLISGNLSLVKGNTNSLTLASANTYTGNTAINGGTLALGASGGIDSTPHLTIAAGGTLDVSAISAFNLSSSTALSANGTTNPATIKGNTTGTVNLGSQPIALTYDGTNAPLTVSQGQLVLNGNAFTVNTSHVLAAGDYIIITNIGSTVSSSGSLTVSGTAISGTVPSILVNGGAVVLHLVPAAVNSTNSTLVSNPTDLPADNISSSTVTLTVNDDSNAGISGLGVTWTVSGSGNVVNPAASGFTDGSGQISFTVASVKSETKTVIVNVGAIAFTNYITFTNPATPLTFTWDPLHNAGGSDGAGTWDTSTANWTNNGVDVAWPNNGGDAAVLGTGAALPSGNTAVTLATPISVGNLTFNTPGGSSGQYQLTGQSITLSNTPVINVAANALISSPLTGAGFVKDGAGTLRIESNATNNFAGNITVSNGVLQLGNNSSSGSLGTGTIAVVDPGVFTVRRQGMLNFSNSITGNFSSAVVFQLNSLNSNAVMTLFNTSTYNAAGGTVLSPTATGTTGTLKLGVNNALPVTTAFVITNIGASVQRFDLAGFNQTFGSLATTAGGSVTNSIITNSASATTSTLTVSGTAINAFNGAVAGNLNVEVGGSGSLTLGGNSYTGNTTVKGGTLVLSQPALATNSTVTVTNGILNLAFAAGQTNQVAALVLNGLAKAAGVYNATTDPSFLAGTGSLLVKSLAVVPSSTNITYAVSGSKLTLNWPTGQGWQLQSNSISLTSTGAWQTITGVAPPYQITISPNQANVFFRLKF